MYKFFEDYTGIIVPREMPDKHDLGRIPPGIYSPLYVMSGMSEIPAFNRLSSKKYTQISSGPYKEITDHLDMIFSKEGSEKFEKMQMLQKTGILLHGKPGSGKTTISYMVMDYMVQNYGAICLIRNNKSWNIFNTCLDIASRVKKDSPLVLFEDEFEGCFHTHYGETDSRETFYLSLLDGGMSFNGFLFLACTNKIEDIPARILHRKGRIDLVKEINSLPYPVYQEYISNTAPFINKDKISEMAYLAVENELTIDDLKWSIIQHVVYGKDVMKTINSLKEKQ